MVETKFKHGFSLKIRKERGTEAINKLPFASRTFTTSCTLQTTRAYRLTYSEELNTHCATPRITLYQRILQAVR